MANHHIPITSDFLRLMYERLPRYDRDLRELSTKERVILTVIRALDDDMQQAVHDFIAELHKDIGRA